MTTKITILEEDHCSECGAPVNAATSVDKLDASPEPGDVCICFTCTSYMVYDEKLKVRSMTVDEIVELPNEILLQLTNERKHLKAFKKWMELQNG